MPIDTAVLLAAGRGARLAPWTDRTPKPLLVHRGRTTLDLVLDSLERAGVTRVVLVVHHLAEQFEPYAARRMAASGQTIVRVRQDRLFGTAHALQCVMFARPELLVTPFVLSATDYLVPPGFYRDLLRFHASHDADLSVSLKALGEDAAARSSVRFGKPEVEGDGEVDPSREATGETSRRRAGTFGAAASAADVEGGGASAGGAATGPVGAGDAARRGEFAGDGGTRGEVPDVSGAGDADADDLAARDILEIVEKPAPGEAPSAIGANLAFVLPPEVLAHVGETAPSARGEREIQSAINAWLAAGGRARGLLQPTPPEWAPPAPGERQ